MIKILTIEWMSIRKINRKQKHSETNREHVIEEQTEENFKIMMDANVRFCSAAVFYTDILIHIRTLITAVAR